jgi:hypothetical protein
MAIAHASDWPCCVEAAELVPSVAVWLVPVPVVRDVPEVEDWLVPSAADWLVPEFVPALMPRVDVVPIESDVPVLPVTDEVSPTVRPVVLEVAVDWLVPYALDVPRVVVSLTPVVWEVPVVVVSETPTEWLVPFADDEVPPRLSPTLTPVADE